MLAALRRVEEKRVEKRVGKRDYYRSRRKVSNECLNKGKTDAGRTWMVRLKRHEAS